jgi:hypothetical protein
MAVVSQQEIQLSDVKAYIKKKIREKAVQEFAYNCDRF